MITRVNVDNYAIFMLKTIINLILKKTTCLRIPHQTVAQLSAPGVTGDNKAYKKTLNYQNKINALVILIRFLSMFVFVVITKEVCAGFFCVESCLFVPVYSLDEPRAIK